MVKCVKCGNFINEHLLNNHICMYENDFAYDNVNHPKHYKSHPSGIECIQITEHMNFNIGNAVKYLWRTDHKNGVEDLKKAAWYINREIERVGVKDGN